MRRLFLFLGALFVIQCAGIAQPVHTLAVRIAPAYDHNNFMFPVIVRMLQGGGIPRAELEADAIYVYFYYEGFAPSEWEQMQLLTAMSHCEWVLRNIDYATEDQVRACAWALVEMRYQELAPDPRDESIQ